MYMYLLLIKKTFLNHLHMKLDHRKTFALNQKQKDKRWIILYLIHYIIHLLSNYNISAILTHVYTQFE